MRNLLLQLSIRIYNPNDIEVRASYEKMCNEGDGAKWNGLADVSSFYLSPKQFNDVRINQNWFANCVVSSWVATSSSERFVTLGSNLSKVDFTMTSSYFKL